MILHIHDNRGVARSSGFTWHKSASIAHLENPRNGAKNQGRVGNSGTRAVVGSHTFLLPPPGVIHAAISVRPPLCSPMRFLQLPLVLMAVPLFDPVLGGSE